MEFNKNRVDFFLMQRMKQYGEQLSIEIDKTLANQLAVLDQFVIGLTECNNKGLTNTKVVWNLAAFVNIISIDLKIITRDLALAKNDWVQRHYIRQAYLLIYEFYNTYYKEQKDYYVLINEKLNIKELDSQQREIVLLLRDYKKQNEKTFQAIRNKTIAHRDGDTILQVEMIKNLNYSEAIDIILTFDQILNKLGAFMQRVIALGIENLSKFL